MRFIILSVLSAVAFSQTCSNGGSGPCGIGGSCGADEVCVTDTPDGIFICCAKTDLVTTTTASSSGSATTASSCVDKLNPQTGVSDCPRLAYLCNDLTYKPLMKDQCPKTCGYCSGNTNPGTTTCQDKVNPQTGVSDCPNSKNLCQDPMYKPLMKDQCPKTCGYCQ